MSFTWPLALALLVVVPLVGAAALLLERRRRAGAARFASPALLPGLVTRPPGWRRLLPLGLALAALAALVVGLARPKTTTSVPRDEATVVLAIDTSRSMGAEDVQPTRLEAMKTAVTEFLDAVPESYDVGIVSFSTSADVVLPPTTDRDAAVTALDQLRLGSGTAIGAAVERSVDVAKRSVSEGGGDPAASTESPPAAVVLLSDGAQTAEGTQPDEAAEQAREAGIPVSTVALGTDDGVVDVPGVGGVTERVTVPPDPDTLRAIAETTGGRFYDALDAERLAEVYEDLGTRLVEDEQEREITALFAGAGAVLLLLGSALSAHWFRRVPL